MRHKHLPIQGLLENLVRARSNIGHGASQGSSFAPIVPVKSMWETFDDPDRYQRTYDFADTYELMEFLRGAYETCDGTQGSWMDVTTHVMPRSIVCHVSVHRGGNHLSDSELAITQDLDSIYGFSVSDLDDFAGSYGIVAGEEFDFEDE